MRARQDKRQHPPPDGVTPAVISAVRHGCLMSNRQAVRRDEFSGGKGTETRQEPCRSFCTVRCAAVSAVGPSRPDVHTAVQRIAASDACEIPY